MGSKESDCRVPEDSRFIKNNKGGIIGIQTSDTSFDYSKEGKRFLQSTLDNAIHLLPEKPVVFSDNGLSITSRVVRGYRGDQINPGVYEFVERTEEGITTYILTHDTLSDSGSMIRAVRIEDRVIKKTEGFAGYEGDILVGKINSFLREFVTCSSYSKINGDNETGIHYSESKPDRG